MARPCTSTKSASVHAVWYLCAFALVGLGCGISVSCNKSAKDTTPDAATGSSAEIIQSPEYKQLLQIMAEERLVADSQPYLALDLHHRKMQIRVYGAVVRDLPIITTSADSATLESFARSFGEGDSPLRRIERVYLFEGAKLVNDTVLGIVTEASKASPQKIQRYRPSRLAITWEGKLTMIVTTSVVGGQPIPGSKNFLESTRSFVEQTFGGERIEVQLNPDEAMSLYGVCHPGLPTLLIQ
jgi:hypothetical protein